MAIQDPARPVSRLPLAVLSAVIGAVAAQAALRMGIPGDGGWIVACWLLGVVAAAIWAAWASYAACVGGIVFATILAVTAGGQDGGLAWLTVVVEAAVLGHGFLVAATVLRAWRLRSLRDGDVIRGLVAAIGLVVLFILVAQDFARNPP